MKRVLLCLCAAAPVAAQGPTDGVSTAARTGFVFDGYSFGSSYAFDHVVEWSVPVSLSHRLGQRFTVDLSSGYAHASATTTSGTLRVSGATDTDVRMSWAGRSGHVIVSVVGTLPTGKTAVSDSTVPLLSALATELLAFTTRSFGTGGGVTGGFATSIMLGERWAAGVGGSYRWHASYTPVAGGGALEPGTEGRVRLGVEGPVGGGGYFRGAAMYASDNYTSGVVNHLRTTESWFKCWGTGQLHAGGNTTWMRSPAAVSHSRRTGTREFMRGPRRDTLCRVAA